MKKLVVVFSVLAHSVPAFAQLPGAFNHRTEDESPINRPIDLKTPRIQTSGITFWYQNKAYRGGEIVRSDIDGKTVTINTTSGPLQLEWAKFGEQNQAKFNAQYELAVAKAVAEAEKELQRSEGIVELTGKVLSVTDDGVLLSPYYGDKVFFLKGHPEQKFLVDGDHVDCKAKLAGVYTYGAVSGARATVRAFKYVKH